MKVVATCGCFDLIHEGHISLFQAMHGLGDEVVVFLNMDESVKRIKGEGKPIMPFSARSRILKSIRYIDSIIPFAEDTPIDAIRNYFCRRPELCVGNFAWLKHREYAQTLISERDVIHEHGGIVLFYDNHCDTHSIEIIKKIQNTNIN